MTAKRATARSAEVYDYLVAHLAEWHCLPTTRELAAHFGWGSKTSARKHLTRLVRIGLLERTPKGLRLASPDLRRAMAIALAVTDLVDPPSVPAGRLQRRAPISGAENSSGSPYDRRRTLLSLTAKGRGTPDQLEAAARLRAHGDDAARLLPPGSDRNLRSLLVGCGCPRDDFEAEVRDRRLLGYCAVLVALLRDGAPAGGVACAA